MYRGDEESGAGSPSVYFVTPSHSRFFAEFILSGADGLRMTAWVLLDALSRGTGCVGGLAGSTG